MQTINSKQDYKIFANCDALLNDLPAAYVKSTKLSTYGLQKLGHLINIPSSQSNPLRLGLFGSPSLLLFPILLYFYKSIASNSPVSIDVYLPKEKSPESFDIEQMKSHFTELGLLRSDSPLKSICQSLIDNQIANILGIQPISCINSPALAVQFHIGHQSQILKATLAQASCLFNNWLIPAPESLTMDKSDLWQLARLSEDEATIYHTQGQTLGNSTRDLFTHLGLSLHDLNDTKTPTEHKRICDETLSQERQALRAHIAEQNAYCQGRQLLTRKLSNKHNEIDNKDIAIIGGGLASTALCLSLAKRGKELHFFCQDAELATRASGNKQGAIYPLLTPENNTLSQFFQQAFLYSRRLIQSLTENGQQISHGFCGVLHTGHDERSIKRIKKIIDGQDWPQSIAYKVSATEANKLANIDINQEGIFYPLGGWVCPHEFAKAAFEQAKQYSAIKSQFNCNISRISQEDGLWYLHANSKLQQTEQETEITYGPFKQVVLANGEGINQLEQTRELQITGFRGQVSHIPARAKLSQLATVLCSLGYLTPHNQGLHCVGASYVKQPKNTDYCHQEQLGNVEKMQASYQGATWLEDIDVSARSARVGVRMVTRDHAPMMGIAPNIDALRQRYLEKQTEQQTSSGKPERKERGQRNPSGQFWQHNTPPSFDNLYLLGGLGSRGLSSGPLAAEALAAQMCDEPACIDYHTLALLSPNRMWLRKLIKGKAVEF